MAKNYIEEFMKDNDLSIREIFLFCETVEVYINENLELVNNKNNEILQSQMLGIMKGLAKIEKIKPKTLMEQLKEQGFGYAINTDGSITKRCYNDLKYLGYLGNGDVFLTETEAEREAYRKKLEFEMKEWARENDCLGDSYYAINPFAAFLCHIKEPAGEQSKADEFREKFSKKVNEYYNFKLEE